MRLSKFIFVGLMLLSPMLRAEGHGSTSASSRPATENREGIDLSSRHESNIAEKLYQHASLKGNGKLSVKDVFSAAGKEIKNIDLIQSPVWSSGYITGKRPSRNTDCPILYVDLIFKDGSTVVVDFILDPKDIDRLFQETTKVDTNLGQREELSNDGRALLKKLLHSKTIRNSLVGSKNAFFTEELNDADKTTRTEYLKEYDKKIRSNNQN